MLLSVYFFWVEEKYLTLQYLYGEKKVQQRIPVSWTPCNYGGKRIWFTCPHCWGRCAVLYEMGQHYGCRKCAGVVHKSNAQDDIKRKINKAARLRVKIGALPAPAYDLPKYKPIHMHYRTWKQIKADIYTLELPFWKRVGIHTDILKVKFGTIARRLGL